MDLRSVRAERSPEGLPVHSDGFVAIGDRQNPIAKRALDGLGVARLQHAPERRLRWCLKTIPLAIESRAKPLQLRLMEAMRPFGNRRISASSTQYRADGHRQNRCEYMQSPLSMAMIRKGKETLAQIFQLTRSNLNGLHGSPP